MERLAASLEAHRRFLADAAHGLRSPIAAIGLQAELAARSRNPEGLGAAHEELIRGTQRASRLVQQLLDFARLEPGATSEAQSVVDLAAVVREVLATYAVQAEDRGVDLGADVPGEAPLEGRESELRTLVANLVDNALRYAPRHTAVTVALRRSGASIDLDVSDAGPGIPAAERERVFERFYRVEGDSTRGTGLGLAIARTIVERHRGSITLEDASPGAPSPGLAVRIRLPIGDIAPRASRSASLSVA
jgi:signal transduction histidine kinase